MKFTHERVEYHKGPSKQGHHCSICTRYISGNPPHCQIVMDPIYPEDGCKKFVMKWGARVTKLRT